MIHKMFTPWWLQGIYMTTALVWTFTTGNYMYIFWATQMSMLINALHCIAMAVDTPTLRK